MPVKKISSLDVQIGMFVTNLDRPWLETPFLFQGFEVRTHKEIDELIRQTKHVYIMVPDEEIELHNSTASPQTALSDSRLLAQQHYEITASAEDEIRAVRPSHEDISLLVEEVASIVTEHHQLPIEKIDKSVRLMVESITHNPDAYIWLTRIKEFDSFVYKDSLNTSVWATALGRHLGMTREHLQQLATGTLLMDVGKTVLPKELLYKRSRLLHEEWEAVKAHVSHSLDILQETSGIPAPVTDLVRTHHERLNGSGYPEGLAGKQIPLFGQIAGMVDFYVAVTTPRPFAKVISASMAEKMLYDQRGHYFDEMLVENFIQVLSTYPTGSLVELSTGEIGVVISQNPGLRLRPKVALLLDRSKKPYGISPIINLMNETHDGAGCALKIVKTLPNGRFDLQGG